MSDHEHPTRRPTGTRDPIQTHLGSKLREFYGSILAEPVPDRLTSLLDQLEKQERATAIAPAEKEEK
ncbi:NepR family anti-sigma factor [Pinisolibacter aquiterrae]|uniref:NepR family anti-sigma factor n=1 Tax=Pinisolibacter aquiterrae TaxID=2815579 RepID=UPI001C3C294F|nr:NepR family anti-sigma factor [Pinisolibacter aquiterrae]MBV5263792.1 hypothetical protein [Pinisolibacter aquiterrae]MCC8237292.1 hypothetical protein [Pinisolibacter aquiterrae]